VHPLTPAVDYQETAAIGALARWWRTQRRGVCALVGIGGCGKTATADEFLRRVGVLEPRSAPAPNGSASGAGPVPGATFVFTFAEGTVEGLLDELRLWTPSVSPVGGFEGLVRDLGAAAARRTDDAPVLIVLDALEAAQAAGEDDVGRLRDPRLRALVTRVAYGALPGVALLVTSRLPLVDVEVQRLPLTHRIEADRLDEVAAAALLRSHGVRGDRRELARVSASYGYHALSLELAGQYAQRTGALPTDEVASAGTAALVETYLSLAAADARARAALDLLCLFRRGVTEGLFARVATELLDGGDGLPEAVARLREMRIVSRAARDDGEHVLRLHEVVANALYRQLDAERRREWHADLADLLADDLDPSPFGQLRLHDAAARDQALDVVTHLIRGGRAHDAFVFYWRRIGSYLVVGHELSAFAWGELVCRALNADRPPEQFYDAFDDGLGGNAVVLGDWALYLLMLGELPAAEQAARASLQRLAGIDTQIAGGAANIADVTFGEGRLPASLGWAGRARFFAFELLRTREGIPTAEFIRGLEESVYWTALGRALTVGAPAAWRALEELRDVHAASGVDFDPERFRWGMPAAHILLTEGKFEQVIEVAESGIARSFAAGHPEDHTTVGLRAVLAQAALRLGRGELAELHTTAIEVWAAAADAVPHLLTAHQLRGQLAAARGELDAAEQSLRAAVRMARDSGAGLRHIDVLTDLAWVALRAGRPDEAVHLAATALFGQEPMAAGVAVYEAPARDERRRAPDDDAWYAAAGIFPPPDSGQPPLLAATHPECGYRWGEAQARLVLAEAMLARLAVFSRTTTWSTEGIDDDGRAVVSYACALLTQVAELLEELSGDTAVGEPARRRAAALAGGALTRYVDVNRIDTGLPGASPPTYPPAPRVLISYTRADSAFVDDLADELEILLGQVWVDRRQIVVGESFIRAINTALAEVTTFVVVLSPDAARSRWVENELGAAVALRNQGRELRIIPVLLPGGMLPPLLADLNAITVTDRGAAATVARAVAQPAPPRP